MTKPYFTHNKFLGGLFVCIMIVLFLGYRYHSSIGKYVTIGGQKDEHGCLIGVGYSWCNAKNSCLRTWEEYCTPTTPQKVIFSCDAQKTIRATFYPGDDKFVDLVLSDQRKMSVPHALSASGARYANNDESFVFWNKGDTAFITENGTTTYANCNLNQFDGENTTFMIDTTTIHLQDGISEMPIAPGSASKSITRYFGNEAYSDLNNDGKEDAVFLVTQNNGGSGEFFYVVIALSSPTGYTTQTHLLGDRIAPQTTEIQGNKVIVNYATRKDNEPMTATPSVGKTYTISIPSSKK